MASFFSSVRAGFSRTKSNQNLRANGQSPSPNSPSLPPLLPSPAASSMMSMATSSTGEPRPQTPTRPPFFFREEYSGLIVKGNFMTLAAKPTYVEEGEWLAHQVVEQYRLLDGMLKIIQEVDHNQNPPTAICNSRSCPAMSAAGHTYTWLDNNKTPIKIPAHQYIFLVQKWIMGKINDPKLLPTDTEDPNSIYLAKTINAQNQAAALGMHSPPGAQSSGTHTPSARTWLGKPSGFPESFESDIRSIYRQMMRCYAHIYHGHWLEPFWHINAYKELNTCFVHFVNVGKLFGLLSQKDLEPMSGLVQIWEEKGSFSSTNGAGSGGAAAQQAATPQLQPPAASTQG